MILILTGCGVVSQDEDSSETFSVCIYSATHELQYEYTNVVKACLEDGLLYVKLDDGTQVLPPTNMIIEVKD